MVGRGAPERGGEKNMIAENNNGCLRRYSRGEYPWSSYVILEGNLRGEPFKYEFPTEINPRGALEVDLKQERLLKKMGIIPQAKMTWHTVYPRNWKNLQELQVLPTFKLSFIEGEGIPLDEGWLSRESGCLLGSLGYTRFDLPEDLLAALQAEAEAKTGEARAFHAANMAEFKKSGEPGDYYPMWRPGYGECA